MNTRLSLAVLGSVTLCLVGCSTYIPPGAKANLQDIAPPDIQAGFATKPTNPFPASIAAVRVQAPGYTNYSLEQNGGHYGSGRYSIVTAREVEDQSQFDRILRLPSVSGLVALNRMLVPQNLSSEREIREAASRLHADLVFLYTFDTKFFDVDAAKPLSVITLGFSPTRKISAVSTISGLLIDTRTGYIYSAYEVTEKAGTLATSWGSADAADAARKQTEKAAFKKLIDEVEGSWVKVMSGAARVASQTE